LRTAPSGAWNSVPFLWNALSRGASPGVREHNRQTAQLAEINVVAVCRRKRD
jgi:hypothetical protein